ncbi:MAG: agmatinase family protein, partial [Planctomycetes bacterium]|nr:agmatinase family protein [Planctomycetota bacterium]
ATTSYRPGTRSGPEAIAAASHQIDLFDRTFGRPYKAGFSLIEDPRFQTWNDEARALSEPIIDCGGHIGEDANAQKALDRVNEIGESVRQATREFTSNCLQQGKLPAILGGDHSVPQGAMEVCAEAYPGLGILHIDAHADLRVAFEGFQYSHASILHNVLEAATGVSKLVQVGLRDVGSRELTRIETDPRILAIFDEEWSAARMGGKQLQELVRSTIAQLPHDVYITFDIDGLDPTLCPGTGTPVPGGLLWPEAMLILSELAQSGRRIVGFDLCEVSPGGGPDPEGEGWDAIVGARMLYKLCGCALHKSQTA